MRKLERARFEEPKTRGGDLDYEYERAKAGLIHAEGTLYDEPKVDEATGKEFPDEGFEEPKFSLVNQDERPDLVGIDPNDEASKFLKEKGIDLNDLT